MIITVTLNPAVDCAMGVEDYHENAVNRADYQHLTAGGKGINISIILNRLGVQTKALGFCGGETGRLLCSLLDSMECPHSMTFLENQLTRINVKLKCGNVETEINGKGAEIAPDILDGFIDSLENTLKSSDTLVLAGSIPTSVPPDIYAQIMKRLSGKGIRICADSSGKPLIALLPYRPFLVKPNNFELGEILGRNISTPDEALAGAYELQKMGAVNILVSLAEKGAVLLTENAGEYRISAPSGTVRNSVGAGDSMLAGFLAGLEMTGDYHYALILGTASGSATAFSGGLAEKHEIARLFEKISSCADSLL
ncbi:MAG: 1-phosphofructokinase [Ruminococcus flavefaciens]|nr:1-phosphofructokinase [Ruminococcus flavefaciens]